MIKILARYIARSIFMATALVALIITSILFLVTLLPELKNIGEGDYFLTQAVLYVLFRLPNEIYQFSPMLVLLGSIVGLSVLASSRELAVMRVSGYSVRQIIRSVLVAACCLIILLTMLGEWVAPHLSYRAEVNKENAKNGGQAVATASGIWFHVSNNFIHVQHVVGRQLLEGVTRYEFNDHHQLQASYFAKRLTYDDHVWTMHNVVKTTFSDNRTHSTVIPKAEWDLVFNQNLLNIGLIEPTQMSLPRLARFAYYLQANGLQASQYQYQFWQRVLQPLASLLMVFLGVIFVLSTFSHATLGWRIIVGILIGFAFFILNALLGQLSVVFQLPAMFAALLPIILFAFLGFYLLRKVVRG